MRYLTLMILFLAILGCSGEKDRGKNKDLDRPKTAEKG